MRPLLLLALVVFAAPAAAQGGEAPVLERMPELIGGLASIQPVYPAIERRAGVESRVMLQFVVNEDGAVSDVVVTERVSPGLDAAAVAAVEALRFTPGLARGGRPVKVRFALPIDFQLDPVTFYTRFDLSLRAERGPGGTALRRIPQGTALTPHCEDGWCFLTYEGSSGYVPESGLTLDPPPPFR